MPAQISTFVFFDTETTGLPRDENNQTKITELSLVAVSKDDISKATFGTIPRVIKKLSLLLNPQRPISPGAVNLNGLTNEYLQNFPTFGEEFDKIHDFINDLPKPVCLIAHNGYRFDYSILLAECNDANVNLPSDLLCYDSLVGFRALLQNTTISFASLSSEKEMEEKNNANRETGQAEPVKQELQTPDNTRQNVREEEARKQESETQNVSGGKVKQSELVVRKADLTTVSSASDISTEGDKNTSKNEDFSWSSFHLQNLYKRLTNKSPTGAHRAEADCFILLECVVALQFEFIALCESFCKLLTNIPPLQRK
ncbi:Three prime repair exonuclease 2 [Eumeta japonica]|uniref:Three prime repair exonuclease 2 n=1 Tax=Eumeta variegata TaxID=151549 RepID=A0A4C1XSP1_EUMVA|nr:Three prime repair exonuclease 2 [Eumeta japonica]